MLCPVEQTSVGCNTEESYVLAQHADEDGRDWHRPRSLGCSPFQGVDLMDSAAIRPLLTRTYHTTLQVQKSPAARWPTALRFLQVDDLRRTHGGVVHAAEEGVQAMATAR
ncbi:hypothetical protein GCM10010094_33030 [Streptomyces flaveus]|uniref:Uncharacterized protein n=1 Tax=Streptomyces flaveus TaxID=66370 RepID=A0A917VF34_9ACTN|nr:hypothetical protein GCM10010094_33030 [Streptomyces flaveus]